MPLSIHTLEILVGRAEGVENKERVEEVGQQHVKTSTTRLVGAQQQYKVGDSVDSGGCGNTQDV